MVPNRETQSLDYQRYYLVIDSTDDPATRNRIITRSRRADRVEVSRRTIDHFVFGSPFVPASGNAALRAAVADVLANTLSTITIEGHADARGSDEVNAGIARQRAEQARDAMIRAGVDAGREKERFHIVGRGAEDPAVADETEDGRASNRRVVIIVTTPGRCRQPMRLLSRAAVVGDRRTARRSARPGAMPPSACRPRTAGRPAPAAAPVRPAPPPDRSPPPGALPSRFRRGAARARRARCHGVALRRRSFRRPRPPTGRRPTPRPGWAPPPSRSEATSRSPPAAMIRRARSAAGSSPMNSPMSSSNRTRSPPVAARWSTATAPSSEPPTAPPMRCSWARPGPSPMLAAPALQLDDDAPAKPMAEDVWGFRVDASMCGCFDTITEDLAHAEKSIKEYVDCDNPKNPTAVDVFKCVDPGYPRTSQGLTGPGGTSRLPPDSKDPCQRLHNKNVGTHEARHGQQAASMAEQFGPEFVKLFRKLQGDPDFEGKMRAQFPTQMVEYARQWNDGHNAAQREVGAYRFNMQFLYAARAALNRICRK